jgi:hypothetical protein
MLPFWISISALSLSQGVTVALPGRLELPVLKLLRRRWWALVPPLSVIGFVFVARAAEKASAQSLTYLALVAVPVLALGALAWLDHGARRSAGLLAPALFALAWADRTGLAGEAAALALSVLSCAALGVLLAAVTPAIWLGLGILAMAVSDTVLVISDLLQKPNDALNAAHPAAGLPQLQRELFGSAVMGYGDLFIAGLLGGLMVTSFGRSAQLRAAALTAALALLFDLLFFAIDELPATVPVALAMLVVLALFRRTDAAARVPQAQIDAPSGDAPLEPRRAARSRAAR